MSISEQKPQIKAKFTSQRGGAVKCLFTLENVPEHETAEWHCEPTLGRLKTHGTYAHQAMITVSPEKQQAFLIKVKGKDFTAQEHVDLAHLLAANDELAHARKIAPARLPRQPVSVTMERTDRPPTPDQILWVLIRNSAKALAFPNYYRFLERVFCHDPNAPRGQVRGFDGLNNVDLNRVPLRLPFPGVDPYRLLKAATEVFVTSRCGVVDFRYLKINADEEEQRGVPGPYDEAALNEYLDSDEDPRRILPYLAIVLSKLGDVEVLSGNINGVAAEDVARCRGILQRKLTYPCLIELIWSYWHEEGMLAQTMNAIGQRFQNLRPAGGRDPLAQLEIDPLRSLNNLLWGYIQDEQHRLSVLRRAHEYDHHYGFPLYGRAVADLRTTDRRSKFLEAFHNLLYRCTQFYREDDDTTVIADAFPVMNAIKETHYLLAQGAHNQFGDLPATARQEMLIEQWLLARPEMREFLGGRVMVPYPEPWMDRVDVVKTLKGWTDVSVVHFHDLAVYGEQILLSIRYGGWSVVDNPNQAANWARYWRHEIQGYIHNYRAATGVDISADITDQQELQMRYYAPSVHLRNRLSQQLQAGRPTAALPPAPATTRVQATRLSMEVERQGQ
jgi:hypothetical protein